MLEKMRRDYRRGVLETDDLAAGPIDQFLAWFAEAQQVESTLEANAMTLATADADGRPSARVVLLKGADERGFRFFTSFLGRKAHDLEENPRAALVFFWPVLERQVRVEGRVERLDQDSAEAYFRTRPVGSQVAAMLSRQSDPLPDRAAFEAEFHRRLAEAENAPVPLDLTRWGGYLVVPERLEFWQGRPSRLHDRFEYTRSADGWAIERLQP